MQLTVSIDKAILLSGSNSIQLNGEFGGEYVEPSEFEISLTMSSAGTFTLGLSVFSGKFAKIYWGDGSSSLCSYSSGSYTNFSHTYASSGNYTITIANADNVKGLRYDGSNSISFSISDAPRWLIYLYIIGSNSITGDISESPINLTTMYLYGSTTITGDIGAAPSGLINLRIFGNNTIVGDISTAPAGLFVFYIYGNSRISDYTQGHVFSSSLTILISLPSAGYGLDSTEVDNLLIDLNSSNMSSGTINISGNNAARTSASDSAVAALQSRGVTVTVNE